MGCLFRSIIPFNLQFYSLVSLSHFSHLSSINVPTSNCKIGPFFISIGITFCCLSSYINYYMRKKITTQKIKEHVCTKKKNTKKKKKTLFYKKKKKKKKKKK